MTFEELYATARASEIARDDYNSRHLAELERLHRVETARSDSTTGRSWHSLARLRRSEG